MNVKMGRPSLGVTKKVSITLPEELWRYIEEIQHDQEMNQSGALRYIIEQSKIASDPELWGKPQRVKEKEPSQ